jgi:hypothetical protein
MSDVANLSLDKSTAKHPGSRGGRGYYDSKGWHYGVPPKGNRRVVTGTLSSDGKFQMDPAYTAAGDNDTQRADAIKLAAKKKRDMGGLDHHVIEHGWPEGDGDNPVSGNHSFSVHRSEDLYDEMRGMQQQGQYVHGVYTARGRKLNEKELGALTSHSDAEIEKMRDAATVQANKTGETYGVAAATPKGGRTIYNIYPAKHKDEIFASTKLKFPGVAIRTVATVKPDTSQTTPKAKRVPAKRGARGPKMADTAYETRMQKYLDSPEGKASMKSVDPLLAFVEAHREDFFDEQDADLSKSILSALKEKVVPESSRMFHSPQVGDKFTHATTGLKFSVTGVKKNRMGSTTHVSYKPDMDMNGDGKRREYTIPHSEYKGWLSAGVYKPVLTKKKSIEEEGAENFEKGLRDRVRPKKTSQVRPSPLLLSEENETTEQVVEVQLAQMVPESIEPKQDDSERLNERFIQKGAMVGDEFETVPAAGHSYKSQGVVKEVNKNGMVLIEHAPWGEPVRSEYLHHGELVRSINLGRMALLKGGETPEIVAYEGPVCRKCGQPESTKLPGSGYCHSCLTPAPPRWW